MRQPFHDPRNECFRPPEIPLLVVCQQCQREFESYLIQWVDDPTDPAGGYWACPTPDCPGRGYTLDIWPSDAPLGEDVLEESEPDEESADAQSAYSQFADTDDEELGFDEDYVDDEGLDDIDMDFDDDILSSLDDNDDTATGLSPDSVEFTTDDDLPY